MRRARKDEGLEAFRKGIRELSRHRPDKAVMSLRDSLASCPAAKVEAVARVSYWLALAELRMDRPEMALHSLAQARRLRPRGYGARVYARRVNCYGMPRRASSDLDDFYAFYSIQVCSFLSRKPGRRFASEAEKDTVTRLVSFAWQNLKTSGRLLGLGPALRLSLFRDWPGVFPSFVAAPGPRGATEIKGGGEAGSCAKACRDAVILEFRRGHAAKDR